MPRRARIHLPGVPLHIVQRGHNREPCFFAEEDYCCYLHWLGAALTATRSALHAYVLMTNHVHLLVTVREPGAVPLLMISLGRRYVQYINRSYRRTGTLWGSRYKSSLVQAETYFLACQRYIELNPVRAAMVSDPAHYRWSSYRFHGLGQLDGLRSPHPTYTALGRTAAERQSAYRALFRHALEDEAIADIRLAVNQGQALGDAGFYTKVAQITGERREPKPRGRPKKAGSNERAIVGGQGEGELGLRRSRVQQKRAWPLYNPRRPNMRRAGSRGIA
jgi:putative transposase